LGYEAIGEYFGAKLTILPEPLHGIQNFGNVKSDYDLFKHLPPKFKIGHYHSWIINEVDFPECLQITMNDEGGLPMAFKHLEYDLRGLMFHPESVMTEYGRELIGNWLAI